LNDEIEDDDVAYRKAKNIERNKELLETLIRLDDDEEKQAETAPE
jgi:hypothetical protein